MKGEFKGLEREIRKNYCAKVNGKIVWIRLVIKVKERGSKLSLNSKHLNYQLICQN